MGPSGSSRRCATSRAAAWLCGCVHAVAAQIEAPSVSTSPLSGRESSTQRFSFKRAGAMVMRCAGVRRSTSKIDDAVPSAPSGETSARSQASGRMPKTPISRLCAARMASCWSMHSPAMRGSRVSLLWSPMLTTPLKAPDLEGCRTEGWCMLHVSACDCLRLS